MQVVFKRPGMRVPVKSWAAELDEKTTEQLVNAAEIPAVYHHVAVMPDAHLGYGVPIGAVVALEGAVSPDMVGVDVACGVLAVPTSASKVSTQEVETIIGRLREVIPTGRHHHEEPVPERYMPDGWGGLIVVGQQFDSARHQLGTLGGGNHFIEIQQGSDTAIWIMIHSGSRNLGYRVAKYYSKEAARLNEMWFTSSGYYKGKWVPSRLAKQKLSSIPRGSPVAGFYLEEMRYCMRFAKASRALMMQRVAEIFTEVTGEAVLPEVAPIDVHHNYVAIEHHYGKNVWVHRKGAILARKGTICIIPGSQGTHSYIGRGLGNSEAFHSCSHGAGRKMGRRQATRELNLAEEQAKLEGVVHSVRTQAELDEAPGAYHDIDQVMDQQTDLVNIKLMLTPLGVLKG